MQRVLIVITDPGAEANSWKRLVTGVATQKKESQPQPEGITGHSEL